MTLAPVPREHSFAMETDVPSDIFYATALAACKGSVALDVAAALVKIARVERPVFDRVEYAVNLVAFVFGFVAQFAVAAGRTCNRLEHGRISVAACGISDGGTGKRSVCT